MKKNVHFYLTLIMLFLVNTILTAQNDPTPDAWEDSGELITTTKKVQIQNNLVLDSIRYLGIGTTNPSSFLHIQGRPTGYRPGEGGIRVEGNFNTYVASIINTSGGNNAGGLLVETTDGNGLTNALKVVTYRSNNPQIPFRIPNGGFNKVFLVEEGGFVGIGTTTPENALDVCGFIRSEEIIVEDEWCDFVFDKNYKLPTLAEQKSFIATNGHLKNFQSEAEMNGQIHLGDVNKRQQQTIEEVMFHVVFDSNGGKNYSIRSRE